MKEFYPTINLLRGVAAFMVCVFHFIGYSDYRGSLFPVDSTIYSVGELGINGVYVFFVISGFVIPLALSKSNFSFKSLPTFLAKRFVRIEIPYIASILLILLIGFFFAQKNGINFSIDIQQLLLHLVYLIPFSEFEWYNFIYWTLAVEFQFYIIIALMFIFLNSGNNYKIVLVLIVFGASNFILNDNRFICGTAVIFLQGIVLFLLMSGRISKKLGYVIMVLCVFLTAYLHSIEVALFSFSTVLIIKFVEINKKLTNRFGEISYSLYLTHGLIGSNFIYMIFPYVNSTLDKMGAVILAILVSLIFAWFFWKLIENPSKKLSKRLFR